MTNISEYYSNLTSSPEDLSPVADAYDYYMDQYDTAFKELNALLKRGASLDAASREIPGQTGYRMAQLQEIEQIMGFLENREKKVLGEKRRMFREHYNRELSDTMVEKYASTDPDLLELAEIRNMFSLVRNKFLMLSKQLEYAHFQITNLCKMRTAGIEGTVL
jgi:hypothetical protein